VGLLNKMEEDDCLSVDSIVNALYESMSFLPGDKPDWDRLEGLFAPNAIFIPPAATTEGNLESMNLRTFVKQAKASLKASGLIKKGNFSLISIP
jgi:hypothetical protein